jgi:PLD-like domain
MTTTRSRRALLAALGAVTLLATVATVQALPAAAGANTEQVGAYTVFNDPSSGAPDYALENHLVQLIDGTPAGSVIQGAMYSWTRTPVAEALARAQQRGVDVELAIDGGTDDDPNNEPVQILQAANLTQLVFCGDASLGSTACIGNRDNSINHNKFFTFSQTGDLADVVYVSSSNLTNTQMENFNNATVVHGAADLYDFFGRHMVNMLAQKKNNDYAASADGYFDSTTSNVRVYLPPKADSNGGTDVEAATDVVVDRLKYITEYEEGCRMDVAHAMFTGSRAPVADELIRIANLGCEIRVTGGPTDYILDRLAGHDNITVRPLEGMHSKYILYTGNYNGSPGRSLLYTGSHNLTGPSLRSHDESMIRVERPEITSAYQQNFELIWNLAG